MSLSPPPSGQVLGEEPRGALQGGLKGEGREGGRVGGGRKGGKLDRISLLSLHPNSLLQTTPSAPPPQSFFSVRTWLLTAAFRAKLCTGLNEQGMKEKDRPLSGPEQMLKPISGTAQNSPEADSGKNPHPWKGSETVLRSFACPRGLSSTAQI